MADFNLKKKGILNNKDKHYVALLPGSKKAKLSVGVPFFLEVADIIAEKINNVDLIIPVAPTTNINEYLFFQSNNNPIANYYSSKIKKIKILKNTVFDHVIETQKNTFTSDECLGWHFGHIWKTFIL